MTENISQSLLTMSEPKGLKRPSRISNAIQRGLLDPLRKFTTTKPREQLQASTRDILYGEIVNSGSDEQLTSLAEGNRQILLWMINRGVVIPAALTKRETYSTLPTRELLEQTLSASDLQALQGALVYQTAIGIKDLDRNNSVAFGGIVYSQSKIRDEDTPLTEQIINLFLAVPKGAKEPGLLPGFLRRNVKGAIHVLPYGIAEKVPGKERETLLMLADDMVALLRFLGQSKIMTYPRFILNATNKTMGEAARKYTGAQVIELSDIDNLIGSLLSGIKQTRMGEDVVKVFIPERDLRGGFKRAIVMRDSLIKRLALRSGISEDLLLKKVRIDAIEHILGRLSFTSGNIVKTIV